MKCTVRNTWTRSPISMGISTRTRKRLAAAGTACSMRNLHRQPHTMPIGCQTSSVRHMWCHTLLLVFPAWLQDSVRMQATWNPELRKAFKKLAWDILPRLLQETSPAWMHSIKMTRYCCYAVRARTQETNVTKSSEFSV